MGHSPENQAARADLPSLAGRCANYLDEADARRLLQDEPIKWRAAISFDLMSGLRRGELLGLRWDDADLDKQQIYIRPTWNYTPSNGCFIDTAEKPQQRASASYLQDGRPYPVGV